MGELGWKINKYLGWIVGAFGFILSLLAGFKLIDFYFADQNTKGLIASFYAFGLVSLLLAGVSFRQSERNAMQILLRICISFSMICVMSKRI